MASLVYNNTALLALTTGLNLATNDMRVALLQTTTTADTEEEVALMNGFTTLGECSVTSYARQALANEAVAIDTTNDRAEFDADDAAFGTLEIGFSIQGMLIHDHNTDDTDSIPYFFTEFSSNLVLNGTSVTLNFDAEGLLHGKQGT